MIASTAASTCKQYMSPSHVIRRVIEPDRVPISRPSVASCERRCPASHRNDMFPNVAPSRSAAAGLFPGSKLTANRNHYDPDFQAVIFCGYGESYVDHRYNFLETCAYSATSV